MRESRGERGCVGGAAEGGCAVHEGDGRRICETSLRKYAQLNFSTPMASPLSFSVPLPFPFVSHPHFPCQPASLPACLAASSPSILRRSPFTSSPSNSPSGLLPLSRFDPSFFSVAAYFFCLASLALARGLLYLFHPPPSSPPASLARSLFCHGALVLALSHSICHPPSFHHPSKPWSLTGDTDIHTHRYMYRVGGADGGAS